MEINRIDEATIELVKSMIASTTCTASASNVSAVYGKAHAEYIKALFDGVHAHLSLKMNKASNL